MTTDDVVCRPSILQSTSNKRSSKTVSQHPEGGHEGDRGYANIYVHSVSSWSAPEPIRRGDHIWFPVHRNLDNMVAVSEGGMAYPLSPLEQQVLEWEYGWEGRRLLCGDKLMFSVGGKYSRRKSTEAFIPASMMILSMEFVV